MVLYSVCLSVCLWLFTTQRVLWVQIVLHACRVRKLSIRMTWRLKNQGATGYPRFSWKMGKGKGWYSSSWWEPHLRGMGRHLSYGISQCYLPPNTSECAPPNPSQAGWYSIYLPRRDGRLSWSSWLDSAPAGSQTSDLSITSPTPNHCTTKITIGVPLKWFVTLCMCDLFIAWLFFYCCSVYIVLWICALLQASEKSRQRALELSSKSSSANYDSLYLWPDFTVTRPDLISRYH